MKSSVVVFITLFSTILVSSASFFEPPYLPLRPYPFLTNQSRTKPLPGSRFSPDPLVNAIWPKDTRQDQFQAYIVQPVSVDTQTPESFVGLNNLINYNNDKSVTVLGPGTIRVDFGVESAGWVEIVSDDMPESILSNLKLSESEDNDIYPGKLLIPKKYQNGIYRLETNPFIYEGVRFGFIQINNSSSNGPIWHIKEVRVVAQTLPIPYLGSFHYKSNENMLNTIWCR